jgi:multidrug transporter EmrE-like cation transporter
MWNLLFYLFCIVLLESIAWYYLKKYTVSNEVSDLLLGTVSYSLIAFLIAKILYLGSVNLGVANAYWNVLSTICIALIGVFFYNETYSLSACMGMVLALGGIYLLS